MTEYQVIARKYRPQRFQDVLGQEAIVSTLLNAIKMGRVAHAYLFCGSRGTGKTTLARLFAKALNCKEISSEYEPCNHCSSCKEITASHSIDVLEIDGASHRGIEDVRQINETVGYAPTSGLYKIYIIDEVHMLTKEAFNALLKTLEEPPVNVKFLFATTEPHKLPPTILSRCQRFNLSRIPQEKIEQKLAHIAEDLGRSVTAEALAILAQLAEGALRDAESLFDQVLAYTDGEITPTIVSEVLGMMPQETFFALDAAGPKGDYAAGFQIAEHVFSSGKNVSYFLEELTHHFRTLLLIKTGVPVREKERYSRSLSYYTQPHCLDILEMLHAAQEHIRFAPSQRIALEMLLLRIIRTHQRIPLETLVQKLAELEKNVKNQHVHITEDPTPKASELPPPKPKKEEVSHHPSRYDTLMQFAAKELGGSLKKE